MKITIFGAILGMALLGPSRTQAHPPSQVDSNSSVVRAIGVQKQLDQLAALEQRGEGDSIAALQLRNRIMQIVMLTSFDVDATLARIDAEAAHVNDSRSILEARKEHRDAALNVATFAIGGALGTAGSAMQLTRDLNHAGNALNLAAGASALSLSIVQLKIHSDKRLLLSPYNMLAGVLGQQPNAQSRYPAVVEAYLRAPSAGDGLLPDNAPPEESLRHTWTRLHRLQGAGSSKGSRISSVTTDPTSGEKLTTSELTDREAMLRDLHGTIALLKIELRDILLKVNEAPSE